jgi:polyisoprenoid-binding protein YceI
MKLALAILLSLASLTAHAAPPCAVASAGKSRLQFIGTQAGAPVEGRFTRFRAEICFDPAELVESRFTVVVHPAAVETGDAERDAALASEDFFATERHPEAHYVATRFEASGQDGYKALGELELRGVKRSVPLAFRYRRATDGTAALEGEATLSRLAFGVGQGDWTDTDWVGDEVRIRFALTLPAPGAAKSTARQAPKR